MNSAHSVLVWFSFKMFFRYPFPITPSFVFQILPWHPQVSWALVSGRRPLWSSQHSTTPDPDASLAHRHGGEKHSEGENRRERCYTSPAAVYCTLHQWSCPAFIYQIQQSATWPPHKTVHQSLRALFLSVSSLSPLLHLSCLDLKTDNNAREDTHSPMWITLISTHKTCFISDGGWIPALQWRVDGSKLFRVSSTFS